MKATIDVPDDLDRRARSEAALRGRNLVEEELRLAIKAPRETRATLAELMAPACGMIDLGIFDLASNPELLAGLGHGRR